MYEAQRVLGSTGLCSFQGVLGKPDCKLEAFYATRSGNSPKGILKERDLNLKGSSTLLFSHSEQIFTFVSNFVAVIIKIILQIVLKSIPPNQNLPCWGERLEINNFATMMALTCIGFE